MSKEVSNSMSKENDPVFNVITPVCKACKNLIERGKCKVYGERPKEYKWGEKYDCPKRDIDKNNMNYDYIKDKL